MTLKRPQIFYGWIMVTVAGLGGVFTLGTGLWSIGIFVSPMQDELGWSRTAIFGALTVRALVAGALSPFIGPFFDTRNGPRIMSIVTAIILGISMMAIRWVQEVWQFYLLFGVLGAVANVSGGTVLVESIVPKWFIRKRGRAVAMASMGGAFGPVFPAGIQVAILAFGWRDAWLALGAFTLAVLLPLAFLIRTSPEDMGLLPDGDVEPEEQLGAVSSASSPQAARRVEEVSLTRGEAFRTPSFWMLVVIFSITSLGVQGFIANWLPYFQDIGFSAKTGALALTVYGAFVLPARFLWGFLAERYSVRYLLMIQHILTALGVIILLSIGNIGMLLLFAVFMGLAYGGYIPLQRLIYPIYYGRAHLGAIRGSMRPAITVASAAGPLLIAGLYDIRGSYTLAFTVVMSTWLLAGLMFMFAKPPKR
jgi:sugar phosphate permease